MIEAVLLDMGGVLLDLGGSNGLPTGRLDHRGRRALLERISARGHPLSEDDLERLLFAPWRAEYQHRYQHMHEAPWEPHLERLRASAGSNASDLELLGTWFEPYAESLKPMPGAVEALAALSHHGYALGLVSNVPLPGALYRTVLERYELASPFAALHFSYDEGTRKPSPRMLLTTLSALGCEPSHAVMVGDRPASDIAAGLAAGARTVLIRSSHHGGPPADATIDSIADLPGLLRGWAT